MDFTQTGNENTTTVTQTSMVSSILDSANNINISSGSSLLSSSEGGSTNILASTLSADNHNKSGDSITNVSRFMDF